MTTLQNRRSPYLDSSGRPQLRASVVAFLDLLGFSHASTSSTTLAESQQLLDNISTAIDDSRKFVRQSLPGHEIANPDHWAIKFFSDNLALGYPIGEQRADAVATAWFIIRCAQRYQLRMALNSYFLRGAITQGPVCLTDEIIFGSALVECYQLESKASIVPRVLLAEPLRQLVIESSTSSPELFPGEAQDSICRDVDGWWFLNYLESAREGSQINWGFVEQHKESILKSLSVTTRHDVLPKFGWACRYHNVFCHWHRDASGYSDRYRIQRVDEQSTIFRLSEAHHTTAG